MVRAAPSPPPTTTIRSGRPVPTTATSVPGRRTATDSPSFTYYTSENTVAPFVMLASDGEPGEVVDGRRPHAHRRSVRADPLADLDRRAGPSQGRHVPVDAVRPHVGL